MQTILYTIPDIGTLTIRKNPKAKRIILKVQPNGIPSLTIPSSMSFEKGVKFAEDKKVWLKTGIERIKLKANTPRVFEHGSIFTTRFSTLKFQQYKGAELLISKKDNTTFCYIPETISLDTKKGQETARAFIINELKKEAKTYLPQRTKILAQQYGFNYKCVFVKNLKTRWGSCSGQNNINLNIHLMRLPEHLSDFIILHELCHTVHKNHGKAFHDLLNKLSGGEVQLNKELNKHNINI